MLIELVNPVPYFFIVPRDSSLPREVQLARTHALEIISLDPHFDQIPGIIHRKAG
jgi:hypothetical protein